MEKIIITPEEADALPDGMLAAELGQLRIADSIDILNTLDNKRRIALITLLPEAYAVGLFDKPELNNREDLLEYLPGKHAAAILDGMSADEATDVFQAMDEKTRRRLFVQLQPGTRAEIQKLTCYEDDTAGALMTTEFIAVPATWTVAETLKHIRAVERTRETVYVAYVVEPETGVLLKALSLRLLVLAQPDDKILSVGVDPITIRSNTDREDVVQLFRRHDLLSVPVVDESNHVIGIVTVDDVLDAMAEEMSEDAQKFGGMEALDKPYMLISFWEMFRKRGGWLSVLFLGELFTASAMQFFEDELEKAIVLTLFIPLIMSSGGNSGSQATSLIIRALALREITLKDWWRVVLREVPTGLSLGFLLGLLGVIRVVAWHYLGIYDYGEHWILIAFTIGATLIAIVTFGSIIGSMLPFLLKRCGFDPASASAPLVATLIDVTGIVIYFTIAALILTGALL